jgi:hypothetical protein
MNWLHILTEHHSTAGFTFASAARAHTNIFELGVVAFCIGLSLGAMVAQGRKRRASKSS